MIRKKFMQKMMPVLAAAIAISSIQMSCFAEDTEVKYTESDTGNGYILVTQEGGPTLSYSPESGVTILEDEGFAFKDLNKNGELDTYEDWRLDSSERAKALADMMVADGREGIKNIAGLTLYSAHTAVNSENIEDSEATATSQDASTTMNAIVDNYIRQILVTTVKDAETAAKWGNNVQALCESFTYGIPANNSSDPRNSATNAQSTEYSIGNTGAISLWPSSIGLAATFDPEIVKEFGQIASKEYRALGIATALSPQIDLATEPRWSRVDGTFGEDSQLAADMARAYVDGFQTTEGSETGWGLDSVNCMVKHWPSGGPEEGGRDGHYGYGKYAVYPGDNFEEGLIPFTEGAFKLEDGTGMASALMPYYTISYGEDNGEGVGNGYSKYIVNDLLREEYGYDGVVCTDWMVIPDAQDDWSFTGKCWGVEDVSLARRHYLAMMAGCDQFGGSNLVEPVMEAYDIMVEENGQAFADARFGESARRILTNMFNAGLFEHPYLDPKESAETVGSAEFMEAGFEAQLKSIVMLKNKDHIIAPYDEKAEKKTVYVPKYTSKSTDWFTGETTETSDYCISKEVLSQYYNVTDDPEEADFAIVGISDPETGAGYSVEDKEAGGTGYVPISLQYNTYTADTARETAIANDPGAEFIDSDTGEVVYVDDVENRSYKGKSITASNLDMLTMLEETKEAMGDKAVIVYMRASNPMVWTEVEPLADAIIVGYSVQDQAAVNIIAGVTEPSGLLPIQQPANMETVEAQYEDVAKDMECYVDSEGNTYDFAYGLNWDGIIEDERTAKYAGEDE